MKERLKYLLPLAVLLVLAGFFYRGLSLNPAQLDTVLLNQPMPQFDLPAIPGRDRGLKTEDFIGQVSLINIFGSWCVACLQEHPFLKRIDEENLIPLYGIDWREENPADAQKWLARHGDPYDLIGADPDSEVAIDLGVTGAPETFVVDAKGVIRYKHIGPLNADIWDETLSPLIEKLRAEAKGQ